MPQILNVAPILFEEGKVIAEKITYSDELFKSLQDTYRRTHLIKRRGDTLLLVPLTPGAQAYGGVTETIDLRADLNLASSLAREAMYRELLRRDVHISNLHPINYLVTKNNLLERCVPDNVGFVQGLGLFVKWELDFRVINPKGSDPFVSMSLNISTAPRITISCNSLLSSGFSITGLYVGIPTKSRNPDLKPHFLTVGRVVGMLDNGYLELDDVREGTETQVDPVTVYLEPREDILEDCIRFYYKEHASTVLVNMQRKAATFHIGDKKLEKITEGVRAFQQCDLKLAGTIPFRIGDLLSEDPQSFLPLNVLTSERPVFVFSSTAGKNYLHNDGGIQKYGPYSKDYFTPSKPRICVVYQDRKKGQVEQVLSKFLDGMKPVGWGKAGKTFEFTGLKTKFYLQDCILKFFGAADDTAGAYYNAITQALQAGSASEKWDLALIQIDSSFRNLNGDNNPYLVAKARFVGQNVPVQEFTLEALGQVDEKIVWSINNMALATYAKLGGTPWLLAADRPIAHEVVFGIGSSILHSSRMGVKEKMIGITTVFTGDGNYFINNISAAVLSDQYLETLLSNLRTTMERVKTAFNWQPYDTVRLIFHAFKTFKEVEATAVKQVMAELGDYNVEFAFIHVAESHPYLLFDTQQGGTGYYKKGIYAPERGKYLQLSEHVSLVSLTGAQELKQSEDGHPAPVQLILHKDSTFKDLTYLSKQVLKFGAHSWRSYFPAAMPVTIYYSQLMAQMLSQLAQVKSWNPDALYNKIGTTRWFL